MEGKIKPVCFGCISYKCTISIFLKSSFYFIKKKKVSFLLPQPYLASEKSGPITQWRYKLEWIRFYFSV